MKRLDLKKIIKDILATEKVKSPNGRYKNMTLTELSTKTGLDRTNLSEIKNAKVNGDISPDTIDKMSAAFPAYFKDNQQNRHADINSTLDEIRDILLGLETGQDEINKNVHSYGRFFVMTVCNFDENMYEKAQKLVDKIYTSAGQDKSEYDSKKRVHK